MTVYHRFIKPLGVCTPATGSGSELVLGFTIDWWSWSASDTRRHFAEESIVTAQRAERARAHNRAPIGPARFTNLVAAAKGFGGVISLSCEVLQADGALRLIVGGKKFKLFLKAIKDASHLAIVPLGCAHHVVNKPLARVVGNSHRFRRIDAFDLLVH